MSVTSLDHFLKDSLMGLSWNITRLSGDSGERAYFIVKTENKSYILVQYPEDKRGFHSFIKIQSLLKKEEFDVPEIYKTNELYGYQLIENIGSYSLEEYYIKQKNLDYYKKAISLIARIQKMNGNVEKAFSKEKSLEEMSLTFDGFEVALDKDSKDQVLEEWNALYQKIQSSPFKLAHCDMHSRNLFIQNSCLYMIDFQDMGFYPEYYDLVSLLEDSYVSLTLKEKEILIKTYEESTHTKVDLELYHSIFGQRGFKAVGCFLKFYKERKQESHLKYVLPTLKRVKKSLEYLGSYSSFLTYIDKVLKEK